MSLQVIGTQLVWPVNSPGVFVMITTWTLQVIGFHNESLGMNHREHSVLSKASGVITINLLRLIWTHYESYG